MKENAIPVFLGPVTSIDKRVIKPYQSQRELNARHDDGRLSCRRGYKNLASAQANFASLHGLAYIQGYNSSYALVEEYLSFERLSTDSADRGQPYSRNVVTGAPTQITNSGTPLSLNTGSDMVAFAFNDSAYCIFPSESSPLYRHTIGSNTSFTGLAKAAGPAAKPGAQIVYTGSGGTAYDQLSWAGLAPTDAGEMACTGAAKNSFTQGSTTYNSTLNSDNTFIVQHNTNQGAASFAIDLSDITAGNQDWTYVDAIAFTLTDFPTRFEIDEASVVVTFTNEDGSPITFTPVTKTYRSGATIKVYCFSLEKTRGDWDNIGTFTVAYRVRLRQTAPAYNKLTVSKVWLGCCYPGAGDDRTPGGQPFAYSYYNSTADIETDLSPAVDVSNPALFGYDPLGGVGGGAGPTPTIPNDGDPTSTGLLGCFVKFTTVASADATVDNKRMYWFDGVDGLWRRFVTENDATTTYYLKASYAELRAGTPFNPTGSPFTNLVGGFPFKGWVIWLFKGGYQNVKHSRVGDPITLASDADPEDDENRGATFSMANNSADEPIGVGVQAGDSALIAGKDGIYEQIGDRPFSMTPSKKLAGSFGVAGVHAFCRFKDDFGNPGAAFVDRHGSGVYFALPSGVTDNEAEGKVFELTEGIRGELRRFLLDEQSALGLTEFSTCKVFVDDAQDCLVVAMGKRAMKFVRPNAVSKKREWEYYEYNTGSATAVISKVSASSKRRVRFMRSTGQFDEWEWNSADGVWIEGLYRDGGSSMPQGYWRSKCFDGPNRRVLRVFLDRERLFEPATVIVSSRRRRQKYQIAENRRYSKCLPDQQGEEHEFEIVLHESDNVFTGLKWDESPGSKRVLT